jgi:hypothetical protein
MTDTLIEDKVLAFLVESTKAHINSQLTYIHSNVIDPIVLLDKLVFISREVMMLNELDSVFVSDILSQIALINPNNQYAV